MENAKDVLQELIDSPPDAIVLLTLKEGDKIDNFRAYVVGTEKNIYNVISQACVDSKEFRQLIFKVLGEILNNLVEKWQDGES